MQPPQIEAERPSLDWWFRVRHLLDPRDYFLAFFMAVAFEVANTTEGNIELPADPKGNTNA